MCFPSSRTITITSSSPDEITPYLNMGWACCCRRKGKRQCWVFLNISSSICWQNRELFGSWASAAYSNSCSTGNVIVSGVWRRTVKLCSKWPYLHYYHHSAQDLEGITGSHSVRSSSQRASQALWPKVREPRSLAPYRRAFSWSPNCLSLVCRGLLPDPGVLPTSV